MARVSNILFSSVANSYVQLLYVDSFRRFVKEIGSVRNPEYDVNIAAGIPKIADYGNI